MNSATVERASAGSHEDFAALAEENLGRLYGAAQLILRDRGLAEEAVQETLLRAWRDIPSLRDPEKFQPWLYRILARACTDQKRKRWREPALTERNDYPAPNDPYHAVADRDQILGAFWALGRNQRTVITLVYYLGFTLSEVAAILGIPAGTAKSRLNRALSAMRGTIERDEFREVSKEVLRGG